MTVRHVIIALNLAAIVALAAYLVWAVLSPKRAPEETTPANLTPYLPDEDLEGRRLERVQGWALLFAAVVAVALPLYWLHEPSRQKESANYFNHNAAARGQIYFSNASMPAYDPTQSLQCANCHGADGQGGPVPTVVNKQSVVWHAPPLNTVLLRFEEDAGCAVPSTQASSVCNVTNIITYGRPGTPMVAWGVEGGGAKNDQAIQDIVAYLRSIQLTPKQAMKQAATDLANARKAPAEAVTAAEKSLATDTKALATARTALQKALKQPGATDAELTSACDEVTKQVATDASKVKTQALACGTYTTAVATVKTDNANVVWTKEWKKRRANVSDGQLLFELNCARCHTAGWSTFDPTIPADQPGGADNLGLPGGGGGLGGGIGFNLRNGDEKRRFGSDASGGFEAQVAFVTDGSIPFKGYGDGGIGSGRMPGFGQMLTAKQIEEIVGYERYCLDSSTFTGVEPACNTTPPPDATSTTTTSPAKG